MGVPKLMFVFLVLCYIDKSLERNTGKHTGLDHNKVSYLHRYATIPNEY